MAMTLHQWQEHRRERDSIARDLGQFAGLYDEDCEYLWPMPDTIRMSAPETRFAPESLSMQVRPVSADGVIHPAVADLIGEGMTLDSEGAVTPILNRTRFVLLEHPGNTRDSRRTYKVTTHPMFGDRSRPRTKTIKGVDMLTLLQGIVCPSIPETWTGTWITADRDWGQVWSKPRRIQDIRTAAVVDGFTVSGPAEPTIRALMQRSFDAWFRAIGKNADPPMVVDQEPSGKDTARVIIRPQDDSIWATVGDYAIAAGVMITGHMWLPGDDWHPQLPGGRQLTRPTIVYRVGVHDD